MSDPNNARAFLHRLERAIAEERLIFSWKADDEIAELGWSLRDTLDQLSVLDVPELLRTEASKGSRTGLIWVFCPFVWHLDRHLWIRLTERDDLAILVSFHLAEGDPWT